MKNEDDAPRLVRDLLTPGFPFSIRDKNNKRLKVNRRINDLQSVNLLPNLERAYKLCLEGKSDKAAKLISEIAGLLVAAEMNLGTEYVVEIEVKNAMPRLLSQIRRELKSNAPFEDVPEAKSA
jgi:hypothetical protein